MGILGELEVEEKAAAGILGGLALANEAAVGIWIDPVVAEEAVAGIWGDLALANEAAVGLLSNANVTQPAASWMSDDPELVEPAAVGIQVVLQVIVKPPVNVGDTWKLSSRLREALRGPASPAIGRARRVLRHRIRVPACHSGRV